MAQKPGEWPAKQRQRLRTPAGRDQVNVSNGDAQQNQLKNIPSGAMEEVRSQKWAVIVASATKRPYASQVQQYKEWKST